MIENDEYLLRNYTNMLSSKKVQCCSNFHYHVETLQWAMKNRSNIARVGSNCGTINHLLDLYLFQVVENRNSHLIKLFYKTIS